MTAAYPDPALSRTIWTVDERSKVAPNSSGKKVWYVEWTVTDTESPVTALAQEIVAGEV